MSQKRILQILLIFSILVVFMNDLLFNETTEVFTFGDELGGILSNLSLAYISSYIFYIVVVVIKEKRDKKNIYSSVYILTESLLRNAFTVYEFTIKSANLNPNDFDRDSITKEEFLQICTKAELHNFPENLQLGSPLNLRKASFAEFISINCVQNVNTYTEKIFNYMPFLDSDFVKLINNLHLSIFYIRFAKLLPIFAPSTGINPRIAEDMFEYFDLARKLEHYNKTQNKKHIAK